VEEMNSSSNRDMFHNPLRSKRSCRYAICP